MKDDEKKPKLDKTRRAWIAALKTGDQVLWSWPNGETSEATVVKDPKLLRLKGWSATFTPKIGKRRGVRGWLFPVANGAK